jgi:ubiquinone/menaquinone biosynthesis C-methylase UbiE
MSGARESRSQELLTLITSSWVSQALYVTAELGLADHLAAGPRSSEALAELASCHEPSLRRLLRALVTLEVVSEPEVGTFELAPLGRLLERDAPDSLAAWARWWGGNLWPVFGHLLDCVRTGESGRAIAYGSRGFAHLERDPEAAAIFNRALAELTRLHAANVVEHYDFSPFRSIVDVGGGYGELLATILARHPTARGILFDRPHSLSGAREHLRAAGVAERCEFVSGDFFDSVPAGADAYVYKSVLHDWDDDHALRLLEGCRRALPERGRLLIVEPVMPERLAPGPVHRQLVRSDLTMLVAHGASERTETEYRRLLARAGFSLERVVPAGPTFSVLEAARAECVEPSSPLEPPVART